MTIKSNTTILLGMSCLCGCISNQGTSKEKAASDLPQSGLITEAASLNSCDREEKMYYFEIDTDPAHQGPEYAGVVYFGCGAENVKTIQRDFPNGAVINLQKSSPRISKLMKITSNGNSADVIFNKARTTVLER